jgi:DGQHR domain-containing protein
MQNDRIAVTALKVTQWLPSWEAVTYDETLRRRRPEPHFYMFTVPASQLKALAGVQVRTVAGGLLRSQDEGIQRKHDPSRSREIHEYVKSGFPWSDLNQARKESGDFDDLKKPGWLPTAIVINILLPGDKRNGKEVAVEDTIEVEQIDQALATLRLPAGSSDKTWKVQPGYLPPCEIIDGQHRLGAFDERFDDSNYQIPVVAFHGLDISWQAYLFYTVNIKPKKINASLAYDMYPLLRTEDWLERFEGHSVYRETRAQELTEALWSHPESPWQHRINMLGEPGTKQISQAAWVRSLLATYVRTFDARRIGGLFGASIGNDDSVLNWTRAQQSALLIALWREIREALNKEGRPDFFASPSSLLAQDQGVRATLHVTNDILFRLADELSLRDWQSESPSEEVDTESISAALDSIKAVPVYPLLHTLASELAKFDWRSYSYPGLPEGEDKILRSSFRGSGGYLALRKELLRHLAKSSSPVQKIAKDTINALGYEYGS